jgi:hypothetical protein
MREIALTGRYGVGKVAIIDDEDYDRVSKYTWRTNKSGYVYTRVMRNSVTKTFLLHRFVMGCEDKSKVVDHKDHNLLNNQKDNLRICTPKESSKNVRKRNQDLYPCSSQYLGVSYKPVASNGKKINKPWRMTIILDDRKIDRHYHTEIEAALAHDEFARVHHGEFAVLNFPNGESDWINTNNHMDGD